MMLAMDDMKLLLSLGRGCCKPQPWKEQPGPRTGPPSRPNSIFRGRAGVRAGRAGAQPRTRDSHLQLQGSRAILYHVLGHPCHTASTVQILKTPCLTSSADRDEGGAHNQASTLFAVLIPDADSHKLWRATPRHQETFPDSELGLSTLLPG